MKSNERNFIAILLSCLFNHVFNHLEGPMLSETELLTLQVVVRHGDRTPNSMFAGYDLYNETFWLNYGGLAQLTQLGMRQQFDYGQFLREVYSDFFPSRFDTRKALVKSTDYDRTLMSASTLLSGLFLPNEDQLWHKDLKWQPAPVHATGYQELFGKIKCDRLEQLADLYSKSDEFKAHNNRYKDFFGLVSDKTGLKNVSLENIMSLCDNVYVQSSHKLKLPNWIEQNFHLIQEIYDLNFKRYSNPEIARLTTGPLLNEIKENLLTRVNASSEVEFNLYSGHDSTIVSLLQLFSTKLEIKNPPYVASIIIELRLANHQYFVRVLYKNNSADEPISFKQIQVDGCDEIICPLNKFLEAIKEKQVDNLERECSINHSSNDSIDKNQKQLKNRHKSDPLFIFAIGFASCIGLLVSVVSIFAFKCNVKHRIRFNKQEMRYKYERVNLTVGDLDAHESDDDDVFDRTKTTRN